MNSAAVGILEFRDDPFMKSVVAGLPDIPTEHVQVGLLSHPAPSPFRLIIDRVSFCDPFLRHLVRYWAFQGTYVLNDPFFTLVYDKLSELRLYDELAVSHPRTMVLPRKNLAEDMTEMVSPPDWERVESEIGFPCVLKPVDGYAWDDVSVVKDRAGMVAIYEKLRSSRTLLVQELVRYTAYYRAFCVNRSEVFLTRWDPRPLDRGEFSLPSPEELSTVGEEIRTKTIALNRAFGLDFNAVEWCVRPDGSPVVIDSYNDVPDVKPEKLPSSCYAWIVDRLCACVREKCASGDRNALLPRWG
jgi:hypothetical protein